VLPNGYHGRLHWHIFNWHISIILKYQIGNQNIGLKWVNELPLGQIIRKNPSSISDGNNSWSVFTYLASSSGLPGAPFPGDQRVNTQKKKYQIGKFSPIPVTQILNHQINSIYYIFLYHFKLPITQMLKYQINSIYNRFLYQFKLPITQILKHWISLHRITELQLPKKQNTLPSKSSKRSSAKVSIINPQRL
jgi:hypothetical protein